VVGALSARHHRILVVEGETLIAKIIAEVLEGLGYGVVGPVAKLEVALEVAREETFSAAILDVTIRGGDLFPVAEILRDRKIPFAIASGYGDWALPEASKDQALLPKPFNQNEMETAVSAMFPSE
jgi:DNA-binding response OmpR family regulator